MRSRPTLLLVFACALGATSLSRGVPAAARAVDAISGEALRTYVETLASDEYRGRGVGDVGNRKAEGFICDALIAAGASPAAADGSCYAPVDVYSPSLGARARLTIADGTGAPIVDLPAGPHFYPLPSTGDREANGPLRAGTGQPSQGVALVETDGDPEAAADAAIDRGASGVVVIASVPPLTEIWPEHPSIRDARYRLSSTLASRPSPVAVLSRAVAGPVQRALRDGVPLTVHLVPDLVVRPLRIHNVLAVVEGRDARHRGEAVVVGAHLDHDGVDADGHVYHGADDNASGTAAVMAAAAAFAQAAARGQRPARGVLFALWNAEEKGELGAEAFVESPPPGRRVVASINLDMVGRHEEVPDPDDWRFSGFARVDANASANTLHVLGYSYTPGLAAEVRLANAAIGLTLKEDYDVGAQDLLHRSDQWPFLRHGIPAVFLTTGLHPDYHTPSDEAARIDFGKLERIARLTARAAWIVADSEPPRMTAATNKHR